MVLDTEKSLVFTIQSVEGSMFDFDSTTVKVTEVASGDLRLATAKGVVVHNMPYHPAETTTGRRMKDTWPGRFLRYKTERYELLGIDLLPGEGIPRRIGAEVFMDSDIPQFPVGTWVEVTFFLRKVFLFKTIIISVTKIETQMAPE